MDIRVHKNALDAEAARDEEDMKIIAIAEVIECILNGVPECQDLLPLQNRH